MSRYGWTLLLSLTLWFLLPVGVMVYQRAPRAKVALQRNVGFLCVLAFGSLLRGWDRSIRRSMDPRENG